MKLQRNEAGVELTKTGRRYGQRKKLIIQIAHEKTMKICMYFLKTHVPCLYLL